MSRVRPPRLPRRPAPRPSARIRLEALEPRDVPSAPGHPPVADTCQADAAGRVACTLAPPPDRPPPPVGKGPASSMPVGQTFNLQSRPGADKVIYLDFDGNTTQGTAWNDANNPTIVTPAFDTDGNPSAFSNTELETIQAIWQRVAEDFAPFDVNVTTVDPGVERLRNTGGSDTQWGIRAVIGGDGAWFGPAGGVAYLGSFNWNVDTGVFIFSQALGGSEKYTAEAIGHEVGHSLGLNHDGRTNPVEEYYGGQGTGATGWAPIMGVSYYQEVTQWSKGEYANANNTEDDLNVITTQNGFGYRPDDYSNIPATAADATVTNSTDLTAAGVIEKRTDVDYFRFTTGSGTISLTVGPAGPGSNLDVLAQLYDAAGNLVASDNPVGQLGATLTATVGFGDYYLKIDGVGVGDPATTGYSDYGSLGQYTVTGTIVPPQNRPPVITVPGTVTAVEDRPLALVPVSDTYNSGPANVPIRDNQTATSRLTVPAGNYRPSDQVSDVDVRINLVHTYDRDLEITLISPTGTRITLAKNRGLNGDNYINTVFDDSATNPIAVGSPPFTGSFRPEKPLAGLNGIAPAGTWTLEVADQAAADTGTLLNWSLTIEKAAPVRIADPDAGTGQMTATLTPTGGTITVGPGAAVTVNGTALTLTGTLAQINASLAALTFTPTPDLNGPGAGSIAVFADDQGNTGTGGPQQASKTLTFDIAAVDDPPTLDAVGNLAVKRNVGEQSVTLTGITVGPAVEATREGQTIASIVATSDTPGVVPDPTVEYTTGNSTATLKFTPVPGAFGTAVITVTATDGGDTSNGGTNAVTRQFTVTVGSEAERPVLDPAGILGLPPHPAYSAAAYTGPASFAGAPVSALTGGLTVDAGIRKGVAVVAADNTKGTWQYNLSGAANGWVPLVGVSAGNALLLADDGNTRVRFVPGIGFNGFAGLTFKGWDRANQLAEGTSETTADGDFAYSTATDRVWAAVGKTNPTVDPDGRTVLKSVLPVYAPTARPVPLAPVQARTLLGLAGLEAGETNLANARFGVAITAADQSEGQWQYQRVGLDRTYQPVVVGGGQILLLRPTDLLRYVPANAGANGPAPLTFVPWDPAARPALPGPITLNPTGTGFGPEAGTAVLDLVPRLDLSKAAILTPVGGGQTTAAAAFVDLMRASRVVGTNLGVAVVGATGTGTWEFSTDGGSTWASLTALLPKVSPSQALLLGTDARVRFTAATDAPGRPVPPGTATLSFQAWDRTVGGVGQRAAVSGSTAFSTEVEVVTAAVKNTRPTLTGAAPVLKPDLKASAAPGTGVAVSTLLGRAYADQDRPATPSGVAVTGLTGTGGRWQYSVGGGVWVDFGTVGENQAVLLAAGNRVRFLVTDKMAAAGRQATLTFKAWDQSAGRAGDVGVDTTAGGLLNSFSLATLTATLNVVA